MVFKGCSIKSHLYLQWSDSGTSSWHKGGSRMWKQDLGPVLRKQCHVVYLQSAPKSCCFASGKWTTKYFRDCPCRREPVLLFGMYLWQKCDFPEQENIKGSTQQQELCLPRLNVCAAVLCPAVTLLTLQQLRVLSQGEVGFILALLE